MNPIPEELPKWIRASVNQHFDGSGIKTYFDGQEFDVLSQSSSYVEVRLGTVRIWPWQSVYNVEVPVQILCSAMQNGNIYECDRLIGVFQNLLTDITIRKTDGTEIGCLSLDRNDNVEIVKYGQSEADKRISLASVEASYETQLEF